MKRILCAIVLVFLGVSLAWASVEINAENFPDDNFRSYVGKEFDKNNDGQLSEVEISGVTRINVSRSRISTLKGIEYFTALTYLNCNENQRIALDVSKNTALTHLDCSWNQLTALDVSKNIALTYLDCEWNQLTALDVSKNITLTYLDCEWNQLTALDVSKNIALTYLDCSDNQLTTFDVSENTALTHLDCSWNQLTALDVSENTALTYLDCGYNQLTAFDVSENTALTYLDCGYNQLTALDMSKNTALKSLYCSSNQLTALDVSKNTALTRLHCSSNQLTELDVSKNTALTRLHCSSNQLTELDVSKNTALKYLYSKVNPLIVLDVSKNIALTSLDCSSNQLTELDVSKNTALTYLDCNSNQLTALNVSNNIDLIILDCHSNQLTELDVSKNVVLEELDCYKNKFAKLDLSSNTALTQAAIHSQSIDGLKLNTNNDGTYYIDLMSDYGLTSAHLLRIITESVKGYDSSYNNVVTHYNTTSGVANFKERPVRFCYVYDTDLVSSAISYFSMDVTISALPEIMTDKPDDAYVNRKYSFAFSVLGAGKIEWSIDDASKLPQGLTFSASSGTIKGTPQTTGEYKFRLTAKSSIGSDTKEFTLKVRPSSESPENPVIITLNSDIPEGYMNKKYSFKFEASKSSGLTWSIDKGEVPGLSMSESGRLSGTPSQTGSFDITVRVEDSKGGIDTKVFTVSVKQQEPSPDESPVIITLNSDIPEGYVNKKYSFKFEASKSSGLTWSIDKGEVPGLSMSESGRLSGTPSQTGSFDITVSVKDNKGGIDTKVFTVSVRQQENNNQSEGGSSGGGGCMSGTYSVFLVIMLLPLTKFRMK